VRDCDEDVDTSTALGIFLALAALSLVGAIVLLSLHAFTYLIAPALTPFFLLGALTAALLRAQRRRVAR